MSVVADTSGGWVWLAGMVKPHFIGEDSRSLCSRWVVGDEEEGDDAPPAHSSPCVTCHRRWQRRQKKGGKDADDGPCANCTGFGDVAVEPLP